MDETLKSALKESGVNLETALERFLGNEALLERFLRKFLEDKSFGEIITAMELNHSEDAFKAAHTLKGVAGNLSIDSVYHAVIPIVEALRNNDLNTARELLPELEKSYHAVIDVLAAG